MLCNTLIKTDHCAHSVRIAVHTVRKGGLAVGLCAQFTVCCTPEVVSRHVLDVVIRE